MEKKKIYIYIYIYVCMYVCMYSKTSLCGFKSINNTRFPFKSQKDFFEFFPQAITRLRTNA